MENLGAAWLYPIILGAGALQAWGPPMNGALRNAISNPWLASLMSFLPIVAFLAVLFFAFRGRCLWWWGSCLTHGFKESFRSGLAAAPPRCLSPTNKSLLLLFFRKEDLPSFRLNASHEWDGGRRPKPCHHGISPLQ